MGAAGLAREAQPRARPDSPWLPPGPDPRNPGKGEGAGRVARPAGRSSRETDEVGRGRRRDREVAGGGVWMSTRTASWPCPRATDKLPHLLSASPAGDQTADKAAVSFLSRLTGDFKSCPRRRSPGGGGRYFQAAVIVKEWEGTGGPEGVTHASVSKDPATPTSGSASMRRSPTWSTPSPHPHASEKPRH